MMRGYGSSPFLYAPRSSNINLLVPKGHKSARIAKISILKLEGIIKKKNSYECHD